jgi:hypothetical protein
MRFVLHQFRPGETIDAVLRLLGRHNYTAAEMTEVRDEFIRINSLEVPRVGSVFRIPIKDALETP